MATWWQRFAALLAVLGPVALSAGCVGDTSDLATELSVESAPAPEPVAPELPETPSGEPEESGVVECAPEMATDIENVIRAQTSALSAGDFETAHGYASPSFRLGVSVEAFEALIVSDYAPLLTATRLEFSSCQYDSRFDAAAIDVQVGGGGEGVFRLRYVMFESEEGWRVNQASNLESLGSMS